MFAPFTSASDVGDRLKRDVFALQVDELRDTEPGFANREQERVISSADPRVSVGSFDQGIGFGAGQEADEVAVKALMRDGEHALDEGTMGWLPEGDEAEEGVDRGEAIVSSAGAIFPLRFEVIEKRAHERSIDIGEQ